MFILKKDKNHKENPHRFDEISLRVERLSRGYGRFHRFRLLLESADFLERIRPKQAAAIGALP